MSGNRDNDSQNLYYRGLISDLQNRMTGNVVVLDREANESSRLQSSILITIAGFVISASLFVLDPSISEKLYHCHKAVAVLAFLFTLCSILAGIASIEQGRKFFEKRAKEITDAIDSTYKYADVNSPKKTYIYFQTQLRSDAYVSDSTWSTIQRWLVSIGLLAYLVVFRVIIFA